MIHIASPAFVVKLYCQTLSPDLMDGGCTTTVLGWPVNLYLVTDGEGPGGRRHHVDVLCQHRLLREVGVRISASTPRLPVGARAGLRVGCTRVRTSMVHTSFRVYEIWYRNLVLDPDLS